MRTVIESAGRSKVFFIGPPADDGSAEVVIACAYEGMYRILSAIKTRRFHSLLSMTGIFAQGAECKMQRLAVSLARLIYSVKHPCHSRYQGKPRKNAQIYRRIQGRRYQKTRHSPDPQRMQAAQRFTDDQRRLQFLHPRGYLPCSLLRIKGIGAAHDSVRNCLRQNRRDARIRAAAHTVYVHYRLHIFYEHPLQR